MPATAMDRTVALKTILSGALAGDHSDEFRARFYRIARRRGTPKALVAVMHHLLTVIYHVLTEDTPYREDGPDYCKPADPARQARRLSARSSSWATSSR